METNAKIVRNAHFAAENVTAARARLAKIASGDDDRRIDSLVSAVNAVAKAEGANRAWSRAARMIEGGHTAAEAYESVVDLVLNGADDSWSGRGNDAKRAEFDGIREAVQNLKWEI